MSARKTAWKAKALALDPGVTIKKHPEHGDQWRVYDGQGELIGWSDPGYDLSTQNAWRRAFWELENRTKAVAL